MKHIKDQCFESTYDLTRQIATKQKQGRKRRWKIVISILVATVLAVSLLIVIFVKINPDLDLIQGSWTYDQYTQYEFDGKGKGYMQLETERYDYTYRIAETKLYIDFTNEAVRDCTYEFSIQGDVLTMTGEEGTTRGQYTLTKNP